MRNVPAECGAAAGQPGVILLAIRTQASPLQPSPAQPSPAQPSQPRHPSVHLQTAAGEAAVSLFMETRVDGSRYYQHQIRAAPVQCAGHILPVTTLSLVTTHHIHTEILLMTITYLQSSESAYLLRTPLIKTIDKAHDRHTSNIA